MEKRMKFMIPTYNVVQLSFHFSLNSFPPSLNFMEDEGIDLSLLVAMF